jgi:hypothetical protein
MAWLKVNHLTGLGLGPVTRSFRVARLAGPRRSRRKSEVSAAARHLFREHYQENDTNVICSGAQRTPINPSFGIAWSGRELEFLRPTCPSGIRFACHVDGNVLTACGLSRAGLEYFGLRSYLLRLAGGGSLGPSRKAIAPI